MLSLNNLRRFEMCPKIQEICETCVIGHFCNKNAAETILKECSELKLSERFIFATNNGLTKFESIFTDIFWNQQDYSSLLIPIEMIKNTFENPAVLQPENKNLVKDQMFIEIIMKFCKLAEDFGGLASSRDPDLFKFAKNFNNFNTWQSKNFYKNLDLSKKGINEIFFYPSIVKQKSEKTQKFLKSSNQHLNYWLNLIKDLYLLYVEVYNSYKHGYRIRFKDLDMTISTDKNGYRDISIKFDKEGTYHGIGKDINEVPKSRYSSGISKVLIFYNSKILKKYPFCPGMVRFEEGAGNVVFYKFHDSCVALIRMMEIFLNNFMISIGENTDGQLLLFSNEDTEIKKFNIKDFEY